MNDGLNRSVNHRIAITTGLLRRMIFRIIAESGVDITPDQWSILNCLWGNDGLTIKEIVTKSRKDFANVTRMIEKLEKSGYVTKVKNKKDGRSSLVYLTEKAYEAKPIIENCWKSSIPITLNGVSEIECDIVLKVLFKIEENILDFLKDKE